MKKIFTLVATALVAVGVNAQEEVWKADNLTFDETTKVCNEAIKQVLTNENFFTVSKDSKIYDKGTYEAGATAVVPSDGTPLSLNTYILEGTAGPVSMHAVSTPNDDASENEGWQLGGGGNNALNTEACTQQFEKYIKPKNGNPSMSYKSFTEYNSDGGETFRVYEDLWTPELNVMPNKGLYYEFTSTEAGKLKLALIVWRPGNKIYFFEKSTFTQFTPDKLSIEGYNNNNTVILNGRETAYTTFTMTDNHDYAQEGVQGKQIFGYMTLDVEKDKTYVLLSPNGQPGLYGFWFESSTGITAVAADKAADANAPIYNLAGQKVGKSFKGIVVKNGKKFIQ